MSIIVDASYGHAQITPKALTKIGATGAILYAGCNDSGKNCTKAELHALLDAGFQVGLVIENGAQDLARGTSVGAAQGKAIASAAKTLGYDGVLYTAADWNSRGAELDQIDAAMKAFGENVASPGLYGNSYALDRCTQSGHATYRWQSNSTSFSNGASSNAHLLQRYNDPRAKGLPVDINDIQHAPLGLMGEDMALDPNDPVVKRLGAQIDALAKFNQTLWDRLNALFAVDTNGDGKPDITGTVQGADLYALKAATAGIAAAVYAKLPAAAKGGITQADVTAAVKAALQEGTGS